MGEDAVPENKDAGQLNHTTEHSGNSVAQAVLNALRHRGYLTIVMVAERFHRYLEAPAHRQSAKSSADA